MRRTADCACNSGHVRSQPARFWVTDCGIAAAFAAAGQLGLRFAAGNGEIGHASLTLSTSFVALIAPPLIFRRAAPFTTLWLVALAIALPRLFADVTLPLWGTFGTLLFALYSCSRHAARPLDRYALLAPAFALTMLSLEIKGFASVSEFTFSLPIVLLAWLTGQGLRWWEDNSVALREHLDDLSATEQARAASAVADERARIARELHDVVAHSISVMVVQAGSARLRLRTDPSASEVALQSVEQTGRQALAEMRRMLGVLRTDDHGLNLNPQPSLRGLEHLLDQMRGAGLTIEARTEGVPVPLPPGLDLSAYRIVQEALTNALKHAGHTSTTVRLAYQPDRLMLDITNRPGKTRPSAVNGGHPIDGGHGIIGMRERAALFGGTMKAEPQPGGGYRVHAALPLPAREPT
jgi:signal transduction histidine kinase